MPTLSEIEAKVDLNRAETIQLAGSIFALVNALVKVWQPNQTWQVKEPTKGPDNILYIALQAHSGSSTPPASDTVNWKVLDLNAEAVAAAEAQTAAEAAQAAAETAETNAETAETNAAASATAAAGSATAAAGSATTAASEASDAAASATAAAGSATAAAGTLRDFQNIYLGEAASDPTVNGEGGALVGSEIYYNTSSGALRLYSGSAWQAAVFDTAGAMIGANNLSDVQNAATARTNLGLSAVAASGAYADLSGAPVIPTDFVSAASGGIFDGDVTVKTKVNIIGSGPKNPLLQFSNVDYAAATFEIYLADAGNLWFRESDGTNHMQIDSASQIIYAYNDFDVAGILSVQQHYKAAAHTLTGTTPVLNPQNGEDQQITLSANTTFSKSGFVDGAGVLLRIDDGTGFTVDLSAVVDTWLRGETLFLKTSGWTQVFIYQSGGVVYGDIRDNG